MLCAQPVYVQGLVTALLVAGLSCHRLCVSRARGLECTVWGVKDLGGPGPSWGIMAYAFQLDILISWQLRCLAHRLSEHLAPEDLDAIPVDVLPFLK